eukprot:gene5653-6349_t
MDENQDFHKKNMINLKLKRISESQSRHHSVRRPEQVVRDVRGLKLRQRVSLVLGDELLRKELEDIVESTQTNGPKLQNGIRTYQDFLLPNFQPHMSNAGGGSNGRAIIPINDIRGADTLSFNKTERILRAKLAAVYRLVDYFGWGEGVYNHISLRVSEDKHHYLINPFGLLYHEITASSLVKIDLDGNTIEPGSTSFGAPKAGLVLHSVIHAARKDAKCAIHVHHNAVVAVSAMKCGLLRISQEASLVGKVSYHDFRGILFDEALREGIANDLGPTNKVLMLRNHGVVCIGETPEEAFSLLYQVIKACEVQVAAMPIGLENLVIYDEEILDQMQSLLEDATVNMKESKINWKRGELEFEAWMRMLDAQGYNTGYPYKCPDLYVSTKKEKRPTSQVAPNVTGLNTKKTPYNYYYETDISPFKADHNFGRGNMYRNRIKWLNSPVLGTQYKKEPQEKTDMNKNQMHKTVENRQEIIRTESQDEVGVTQTEVTETTETIGEDGESLTTVKRKVVTVTQGHEEVIEDTQVIVGNESALKSVVDDGFVVVEKEEFDETAIEKHHDDDMEKEHAETQVSPVKVDPHLVDSLQPPGSPASQHSSTRSDDEDGTGEHGDDDKKKVKKQKSFKKAFMKKFHAKK